MFSHIMGILFFIIGVTAVCGKYIGPDPCTTDADCKDPNSHCFANAKCFCNSGYVDKNKVGEPFVCIKAAGKFGDNCTVDGQCNALFGIYGLCADKNLEGVGRCDCTPGTHYKEKFCYLTSYIGDRCRVNGNCFTESYPKVLAYCHRGYCICASGHHPIKNRTDCAPSSKLGGRCSSDYMCKVPNTVCMGMCDCEPDYVLNEAKDKCLPTATSTNARIYCEEDIQCSTYINLGVCDPLYKKCVCQNGDIQEVDGKCWRKIGLNESCSHRMECIRLDSHDDGIDCIGGLCQCEEDYIRIGQDCFPIEKSLDNSACNIYFRKNLLILILTLILLS